MTAADFAIVPDADAPQVLWITWAGGRRPVHIQEPAWVEPQIDIYPGTHGAAVIVTERSADDELLCRSRVIVHHVDDAAVSHVTPWREKKMQPK